MMILSEELVNDLKDISLLIRKRIIVNSAKAKIPHLGSCLSCVDILIYLYWIEMSLILLNKMIKKGTVLF